MDEQELYDKYGSSAATTYINLVQRGCDPEYADRVASYQTKLLGKSYGGGHDCVRYRRAYPKRDGGAGMMSFKFKGPAYRLTKWQHERMVRAFVASILYDFHNDIPLEQRRLIEAWPRDIKTSLDSGLFVVAEPDLLTDKHKKWYTFGPLGREIVSLWKRMGYCRQSIHIGQRPPKSFDGGK